MIRIVSDDFPECCGTWIPIPDNGTKIVACSGCGEQYEIERIVVTHMGCNYCDAAILVIIDGWRGKCYDGCGASFGLSVNQKESIKKWLYSN